MAVKINFEEIRGSGSTIKKFAIVNDKFMLLTRMITTAPYGIDPPESTEQICLNKAEMIQCMDALIEQEEKEKCTHY